LTTATKVRMLCYLLMWPWRRRRNLYFNASQRQNLQMKTLHFM